MVGKSLKGSLSEAAISGERSPRLGPGGRSAFFSAPEDLSEEGKVENVDLDLYEREVLGVAGLVGSGQSELVGLLGRRPNTDRAERSPSTESRCASSRRATRSGSASDFCRRTARRKASCPTCRSRGTSRSRACRCSRGFRF